MLQRGKKEGRDKQDIVYVVTHPCLSSVKGRSEYSLLPLTPPLHNSQFQKSFSFLSKPWPNVHKGFPEFYKNTYFSPSQTSQLYILFFPFFFSTSNNLNLQFIKLLSVLNLHSDFSFPISKISSRFQEPQVSQFVDDLVALRMSS